MALLVLILALQLCCVVHCIRHACSRLWIVAILVFPLLGCLAYAWFEILPAHAGRREVRAVRAAMSRKLDPQRAVRRAREALDMADTAANQSALGDALAETGAWAEAAVHYAQALAKSAGGRDRACKVKLARAELEAGNARPAHALLEELPPSGSASENDRVTLLLARSLDEMGDEDRALALYEDVGSRLAGAEAQCRQAALLIRVGRFDEAIAPLEEAERRARRIDRLERMRDAAMYEWAARTLAELRAAQP
ncbi:hypothetical protein E2493_19705 [Sphingomonas parva]|uniref:Tetratricopeptide repeat protein n=1 Tax=Sphingomonas parva TaxID=2555898 RepID=A0A4Y8ZQ90_9SPHN|nr:hypothetical protein [Sphingomonas parva]TFI56566.1 hypothetical protein E2493_19705 [Sphingomonas parva]